MATFNTQYYHPLDRDYGASANADEMSTNDVGYGIKDVGFSVPFGIAAANVQGVAAKIRTGARLIELQFPGAGRSQRGAQTPELYGQRARTALAELAKANQVEFTTHASFSVMGLAGMDSRGGGFSKENKKFSIQEIQKAIEFAADVAGGGNVTIHTGEFQRPISEAGWNKEGKWAGKFRAYTEEPERFSYKIVDDRTGSIKAEARKDQRVARPKWNTYEGDESYVDKNGKTVSHGDYIDYFDNKISPDERVPKYDKTLGRFEIKYYGWEDFEKEAREMTERARAFWRENKDNPEKWERVPWYIFRAAQSEDEITIRPEEAHVLATLETNAANARGWALHYGEGFEDAVNKLKKLEKAKEIYKKIEEGVPEGERWRLMQHIDELRIPGVHIPPEEKLPSKIIEELIKNAKATVERTREGASAQEAQARDAEETMRHLVSAEKYALEESYDSYAQAGMKALEQTSRMHREGKTVKKPIFVAMEHIFPESYGGHPDELIDLVEGGRKKMTQMLVQTKGMSEDDAARKAEEHIKGHLDTGHINIWRKYWQGDKNKLPEQNEREFNQWMLEKVEEMASKKIIGSVHLDDNWGYEDEHLSPGEGNAPVREMVQILKKHDFKGALIVEPGADATTDLSDFHGLMKTWRLFGSPVYGAASGARGFARNPKWGQVQYSYFGQTEPPYFIFGGYSPSEDWTLWSGVKME